MTHTFAEMAIPLEMYEEIAMRLKDSGYDHAFILDDDHEYPTLDMHGIGITPEIPDMEQEPSQTEVSLGQVGYEAYCEDTGGVSAVSGAKLPAWDDLPENIKRAWNAAGAAIEGVIEDSPGADG